MGGDTMKICSKKNKRAKHTPRSHRRG